MSVQATFCATLVDEWASLGVTDAVVCPGSRSTPLALALSERLRVHVRLDERSAAFFALGIALSTSRPVVICVTSGTAAAELHPAVVEAHHARVPLLVCTADRPPELHETGAPQTIEQVGLFGPALRWSFSPGVPTGGQDTAWRPLAVRAFNEAVQRSDGPGPVHLNLQFREPLTGSAGALPPRQGPRFVGHGSQWPKTSSVGPLNGRGILVVGGVSPARTSPAKVLALADRLRWPILADPLSRCRLPGTIAAADAIVRSRPALPDTVVLLGRPWLSRALGEYLTDAAAAGARVIVVDPAWQWADPIRAASEFHGAEPDQWLDAAHADVVPCENGWLRSWQSWEERAQTAIADALATEEITEPALARITFLRAAAADAALFVAASMPVRDVEWFAPAVAAPPRVLANRGANGIDGVVSSALGVAASGQPTVTLLGDLAFLHDVSGLVNLPEVACTFVVADNGGGGIFSFLPQSSSLDPSLFEQLFGTPPVSDVAAVARGFGLAVVEVHAQTELDKALAEAGPSGTPTLIRAVVPDRARNVLFHEEINQAVRRALR